MPSVPDFDDGYDDRVIIDFVNNTVDALPDAVALQAGELFAAAGARIIGE